MRMRLSTVTEAAKTPSTRPSAVVIMATVLLLAGCDMLGVETPAKQAERREADGKAIGAGCRHTQRSLEDCYAANPKASKAAIFAGWREMDEYMRENNIPAATAPAALKPTEGVDQHEEIVSAPTDEHSTRPAATPATASPPTKPKAQPQKSGV